MPLFTCSFISNYCLLYLFLVYLFFRTFAPFIFYPSFPFVYLLIRGHFPSLLPSFIVFLAFYIFLFLSFFISLSLFYFFTSVYFSSFVVNALAAVYFRHYISKILSETSILNRCSFHVCQFEFA